MYIIFHVHVVFIYTYLLIYANIHLSCYVALLVVSVIFWLLYIYIYQWIILQLLLVVIAQAASTAFSHGSWCPIHTGCHASSKQTYKHYNWERRRKLQESVPFYDLMNLLWHQYAPMIMHFGYCSGFGKVHGNNKVIRFLTVNVGTSIRYHSLKLTSQGKFPTRKSRRSFEPRGPHTPKASHLKGWELIWTKGDEVKTLLLNEANMRIITMRVDYLGGGHAHTAKMRLLNLGDCSH